MAKTKHAPPADEPAAPPAKKESDKLRAVYEELAAECTALANELPKKRKALAKTLESELAKQINEAELEFQRKKNAKREAFAAWDAAVAAESAQK